MAANNDNREYNPYGIINIDQFGRSLKNRRETLGITQEAVVQKIKGLSRGTLSNWENGVNFPNTKNTEALAEFFKTTVDGLTISGGIEVYRKRLGSMVKADMLAYELDKAKGAARKYTVDHALVYVSTTTAVKSCDGDVAVIGIVEKI